MYEVRPSALDAYFVSALGKPGAAFQRDPTCAVVFTMLRIKALYHKCWCTCRVRAANYYLFPNLETPGIFRAVFRGGPSDFASRHFPIPLTFFCLFFQGFFKVLGKGKLPQVPIIVRAKVFSKLAEHKIRAAGGACLLSD